MIGAYIRVSTTSQNHAGQRRELERWMIGNGHDPAEARWYEDTESGDTLARPGFEAMQAAMDRLMEEVKKYQEQEQSQIQKPDSRIIVP